MGYSRWDRVAHQTSSAGELALEHVSVHTQVLAVDMEKLHVVFREFVKIQQAKRRCTIKRLGVHLLCMDGALRVLPVLAKWFRILVRSSSGCCQAFGCCQA